MINLASRGEQERERESERESESERKREDREREQVIERDIKRERRFQPVAGQLKGCWKCIKQGLLVL